MRPLHVSREASPHHGSNSSAHATTRPCLADHCRRADGRRPGGFGARHRVVARRLARRLRQVGLPCPHRVCDGKHGQAVRHPADRHPVRIRVGEAIGRVVRRDHRRGARQADRSPTGFTLTKAVSTVTWTAAEGQGVAPGEFNEFELSVGPFPKGADPIVMPAAQTYSDGEVVQWDEPTPASGDEPEHPVPTLDTGRVRRRFRRPRLTTRERRPRRAAMKPTGWHVGWAGPVLASALLLW